MAHADGSLARLHALDAQSASRISSSQVIAALPNALKELVENSLDAGATTIQITLENYGADCIEVSDNGSGIATDDFQSLVTRNSTSKISKFEDISAVLSFGFRGEALASLCEISESLLISTKTKSDSIGHVLRYDCSGKLVEKTPTARPNGTTITIRKLFNPLPVRRGELVRNAKREYTKALRYLQAYAIISTGVKLVVSLTSASSTGISSVQLSQSRAKARKTSSMTTSSKLGFGTAKQTAIASQGSKNIRDNISNIFGASFLSSLVPICVDLNEPLDKGNVGSQSLQAESDSKPDNDTDVAMLKHTQKQVASQANGSEFSSLSTLSYSSDNPLSQTDPSSIPSKNDSFPSSLQDETAAHQADTFSKQKIDGFVSKMYDGVGRSNGDRQFIYLHGRPIECPRITRALNEVWRQYNMKTKPACILNLFLKPGEYDINVTPEKRDVFLTHEAEVIGTLKRQLERVWGAGQRAFAVNNPLRTIQSSISIYAQPSDLDARIQPSDVFFSVSSTLNGVIDTPSTGSEASSGTIRSSHVFAPGSDVASTTSTTHSNATKPCKRSKTTAMTTMKRDMTATAVTVQESTNQDSGAIATAHLSTTQDRNTATMTTCESSAQNLNNDGETMTQMGNHLDDTTPQQALRAIDFHGETSAHVSSSMDHTLRTTLANTAHLESCISPCEGIDGSASHKIGQNEPRYRKKSNCTKNPNNITMDTVRAGIVRASSTVNTRGTSSSDPELTTGMTHSQYKSDVSAATTQSNDKVNTADGEHVDGQSQKMQAELTLKHPQSYNSDNTFHRNNTENVNDTSCLHVSATDSTSEVERSQNTFDRTMLTHSPTSTSSLESKTISSMNDDQITDKSSDPYTLLFDIQALRKKFSVQQPPCPNVNSSTSNNDTHAHIKRPRQFSQLYADLETKLSQSSQGSQTSQLSHNEGDSLFDRNSSENPAGIQVSAAAGSDDFEMKKKAEDTLTRVLTKAKFAKMRVIGQFNLGFIIAQLEGTTDLFILDQHACDEKARYETLQTTTVIHEQPLFCAQSLELTASEEETILAHMDTFKMNGFRFDVNLDAPFGERIKLAAIPFSKHTRFGVDDIHELASLLADQAHISEATPSTDYLQTNKKRLRKSTPSRIIRLPKAQAMFASRACRSAIMIGQALERHTMERVVAKLAELDQPWNCPHGRPTLRHLVDLSHIASSTTDIFMPFQTECRLVRISNSKW